MSRIVKPNPVVRIEVAEEDVRGGWWVPVLLALLATLAVLTYIFWPAIREVWATPRGEEPDSAALLQRIEALERENDALRKELAFARRSSEIDKKANVALVDALSDREKQAAETKQELSFYKKIVSEENVAEGIEIRSFSLAPVGDGKFTYKLVLNKKSSRKKQPVRGNVEFRVQGRKAGKSVTLGWREIRGKQKRTPHFRFQYFQKLEGTLSFPEGFAPENILVKVEASGSSQPIQQSYSWNAVVKGGEES